MITFPRIPFRATELTTVPRGSYYFRLKQEYPRNGGPAASRFTVPFQFDVRGKQMRLARAQISRRRADNNTDRVYVEMVVDVLENPIPLLLLIGGAAAAIGLAGWGISETLDNTSKLLNHPLLWATVIIGGIYLLQKAKIIRLRL